MVFLVHGCIEIKPAQLQPTKTAWFYPGFLPKRIHNKCIQITFEFETIGWHAKMHSHSNRTWSCNGPKLCQKQRTRNKSYNENVFVLLKSEISVLQQNKSNNRHFFVVFFVHNELLNWFWNCVCTSRCLRLLVAMRRDESYAMHKGTICWNRERGCLCANEQRNVCVCLILVVSRCVCVLLMAAISTKSHFQLIIVQQQQQRQQQMLNQ